MAHRLSMLARRPVRWLPYAPGKAPRVVTRVRCLQCFFGFSAAIRLSGPLRITCPKCRVVMQMPTLRRRDEPPAGATA